MVTVGAFSFGTSLAVWYAIKRVMGLRVSSDHELIGLDIAEMGMKAYPEGIAGRPRGCLRRRMSVRSSVSTAPGSRRGPV